MDLVIKDGTVVVGEQIAQVDIGVCAGKIKTIGVGVESDKNTEIINAKGKLVLPGIIDAHTHFKLPFCGTVTADDFNSGTIAALMGGVTTIIDFANPPPGGSILEPVETRLKEMSGNCVTDYSLHASACGMHPGSLNEFEEVVARGITSLKLFMTYRKEQRITDDGQLLCYMERARDLGAVITVHAENDPIIVLLRERLHNQKKSSVANHGLSRPAFTESEAISRAAKIAEYTGARLHIVHMTTGSGVEEVARAKENGVSITCETCPQYLALDESVFETEEGFLFATCPPLRSVEHVERLWEGIRYGVVDMIATDHCVFTREQKLRWNNDFTQIPYGMPGVETTLPIVFTLGLFDKGISLSQLVSCVSTMPARIFDLFPRKGVLLPGSDADIIILDPEKPWNLSFNKLMTPSDWSPFEGFESQVSLEHVFVRGNHVVDKGIFIGNSFRGELVPRFTSNRE